LRAEQARAGRAWAQFSLGNRLVREATTGAWCEDYEHEKLARGLELLNAAKEQNHVRAMLTLAWAYKLGWGVPVSNVRVGQLYARMMEIGTPHERAAATYCFGGGAN
jgi:hypothetical protein